MSRPAPAAPYAFVSHASIDRERVLPVVEALRRAGVPVWLDQQGIEGGENYALAIAEAIEGCAALVLLCSAASLASRNVRQEVALAWKYARPYVPLLLEPVTIPKEMEYWLEAAQWVDVLEKPESQWLPAALAALARHGVVPTIAAATTATMAASAAPRHNLPRQLTSFVGREAAIAAVVALLDTAALVTLTGVGGTGKTRLALAVAERVLSTYPDGVWLVELAPLTDPALVPQAVASALGIREQPGEALPATLARALQPQQLLLVLDNCEHLIDTTAQLAEALLRACPALRILATSREQLGVPGEQSYRVPSLTLPGNDTPLDTLAQVEAVQLFVARAQAAQPRFALAESNAAIVAQVCARLDGIPLALELAAARLRALTVEQLAQRLDDRFRLLTGGSRTALPRQQTLQAAIDWSYRLLEAEERTLLQRVSVFAGGWTLDAAEAVCADETLEAWRVLDLLTGLVDKSLVVLDETGAEVRYRLLETVRQYAQERLLETDDPLPIRARHAAWCQALVAREAPPTFTGGAQLAALAALDAERDNLRQALAWSREHDPAVGLRMAGELWRYWLSRGLAGEARSWLTTFLASPGPPDRARAAAWRGLGQVEWFFGELRAASEALAQSRAIFRSLHDQVGEAGALTMLALPIAFLGDWVRARQLREEALAIAEAASDQQGIGVCRYLLGTSLVALGDHDRGIALIEAALPLLRAVDDQLHAGVALAMLGRARAQRSDQIGARAAFAEARGINRFLGDQSLTIDLAWHEGRALYVAGDDAAALLILDEGLALGRQTGDLRTVELLATLGLVKSRLGDRQGARQAVAEGLRRSRRIDYHDGSLRGLEAAGLILGAEGWSDAVVRLLGAAASERARCQQPLPPAERAGWEAALRAAEGTLGGDAFAVAWTAGQALTFEAALDEAQALLGEDQP